MQIFLGISMVIFLFLALVWTRKTWTNVMVKALFFGMGGWSGVLLASSLGYIVKG